MMNCIIIDDEPLALLKLSKYIQKIPFLHLEKACQDTFTATEILKKQCIDLLFTDIDMPDTNGVDFIQTLKHPPLIIFTTAYPAYAIYGFKLDAVDYLLKPFEYQDCLKAAEKARKIHELNASKQELNEKSLFVKSDYKMIRIEIEHIKYIESMSEYVRIYTDDREKPVITLGSLQRLETRLPSHFMRVHRSYIVNLQKVTEISRFRICLGTKTLIPVGENYKEKFTTYIQQYEII